MTPHEWLLAGDTLVSRRGSGCRVPAAESTASSRPFWFPPSSANPVTAPPSRAGVTQGLPRGPGQGSGSPLLVPGLAAAGGGSLGSELRGQGRGLSVLTPVRG